MPVGIRFQPQETQIGRRPFQRRRDGFDHIGGVFAERLDHVRRAGQKDPRIPQILARGEHLRRLRRIRLFDEADQIDGVIIRIGGRRQLQIAVTGFGAVGGDAEGHDLALRDRRKPAHDGRAEGIGIRDRVVRGRDQHDRIGLMRHQIQRRRQHGGGGIAALRFDHHSAGIDADLLQLFDHDEAEIRAGHHQRRGKMLPFGRGFGGEAQGGLLEQRLLAQKRGELLGIRLARQGPQPGARAAAEKNGND